MTSIICNKAQHDSHQQRYALLTTHRTNIDSVSSIVHRLCEGNPLYLGSCPQQWRDYARNHSSNYPIVRRASLLVDNKTVSSKQVCRVCLSCRRICIISQALRLVHSPSDQTPTLQRRHTLKLKLRKMSILTTFVIFLHLNSN